MPVKIYIFFRKFLLLFVDEAVLVFQDFPFFQSERGTACTKISEISYLHFRDALVCVFPTQKLENDVEKLSGRDEKLSFLITFPCYFPPPQQASALTTFKFCIRFFFHETWKIHSLNLITLPSLPLPSSKNYPRLKFLPNLSCTVNFLFPSPFNCFTICFISRKYTFYKWKCH